MSLKGKIVFVTGASSGIGAATALAFAAEGARLLLAARRMDKLAAVAEAALKSGAEAIHTFSLDVRDRTEKHESVVKGFEDGTWAEGIAGYADKKPEELAHPEFRKIGKSDAFWTFLKQQSQYIQDGMVKYADPVAIHEVLTAYERKTGKPAAAKPTEKQDDAVLT